MKFILRGPFRENVYKSMNFRSSPPFASLVCLMRKVGYYFQGKDEEKSELIFVRPSKGYPRFHIYLKLKNENLIFNLHLDQKKPIYKGAPAHAGEYEGEIVEKEAERIKQTLQK